MGGSQQVVSGVRQCVYCGKPVAANQHQCPHCREAVPKARVAPPPAAAKGGQITRGCLYMVLALAIHYLALRSDSLNLPISINPAVSYLATMLFLGGLGLALYGMFTKVTA